MGLLDFIKKPFIDVLQWTEDQPGTLARGILSEAEFSAKKTELLKNLG